ncbi:hypothetical protein EXN66_Car004529 [Channa argus]|uniref:Tetratricopeptide repeat protein 23 n=1 Tax=Channa argus TaxID=215402 RepID=A0A6G1PF42_CHAAH|nr:hypothetical protein EXN66_Car004529 [Channa argus]
MNPNLIFLLLKPFILEAYFGGCGLKRNRSPTGTTTKQSPEQPAKNSRDKQTNKWVVSWPSRINRQQPSQQWIIKALSVYYSRQHSLDSDGRHSKRQQQKLDTAVTSVRFAPCYHGNDNKNMTQRSKSSAEFPERMGSTNRDKDESPSRSSDVSSVLQAEYAKSELLMMPLEEKLKYFDCRAQAHEDSQEEAESSFLEAEQILLELYQHNGITQEEKIKTQLEISTGLCRVYKRLNRPEEALSQCEKSLQVLKDCDRPEKTCSVYRDMGAIEHDKDSAGHYFEQCLSGYKNSRCVEIQKASLASKSSTFGELSAEVADTLQLIGSVEMTKGKMKQAHRTMTKAIASYRTFSTHHLG